MRALGLVVLAIFGAIGIGIAVESATSNPPTLRAVIGPGCSTAVADGRALTSSQPRFVPTGGAPFGVAVAKSADEAFVPTASATDALSLAARRPRLLGQIGTGGEGAAVTPDGRYVLVARSDGAAILPTRPDGAAPESLSAPGSGAIEVAVAPNGGAAFVSLEGSSAIAVFRLDESNTGLSGHYLGEIPVGLAPVGLAFSPDGRWLYSTSEGGSSLGPDYGSLRVINVARAEQQPATSVVATVGAGCSPVRVAVSPDGAIVWVTARESDALLGFSAQQLLDDPPDALVANVRVGEAPVGLAVIDDGSKVVVADSNRFDLAGAHADLLVVSTSAALSHHAAVLGHITSKLFPRDMAATPNGRSVLVANFGSGQLEEVTP